MKGLIFNEHSECCDAPVALFNGEQPANVREIFYFRCSKCKNLCHLKRKSYREETHVKKTHKTMVVRTQAHNSNKENTNNT